VASGLPESRGLAAFLREWVRCSVAGAGRWKVQLVLGLEIGTSFGLGRLTACKYFTCVLDGGSGTRQGSLPRRGRANTFLPPSDTS
jgi:hypothetical protein